MAVACPSLQSNLNAYCQVSTGIIGFCVVYHSYAEGRMASMAMRQRRLLRACAPQKCVRSSVKPWSDNEDKSTYCLLAFSYF